MHKSQPQTISDELCHVCLILHHLIVCLKDRVILFRKFNVVLTYCPRYHPGVRIFLSRVLQALGNNSFVHGDILLSLLRHVVWHTTLDTIIHLCNYGSRRYLHCVTWSHASDRVARRVMILNSCTITPTPITSLISFYRQTRLHLAIDFFLWCRRFYFNNLFQQQIYFNNLFQHSYMIVLQL